MAAASATDQDFIALFEQYGGTETARRLDLTIRGVMKRRVNLEKKLGRQITPPKTKTGERTRNNIAHPYRLGIDIQDGIILVGSDAHYWPGIVTTAHRAFVRFCERMQPKHVIMNGDVLDGATISRHAPIGWENRPTLIDEIETCKTRLDEIKKAAGNAKLYWTLGNHDSRFETRLATVAPEYAKIHGVHLKDHFPEWWPAWAVWVNDDLVIKHRFKAGIHAPHNNTMWAGRSMVTGHLHSLKVYPLSDYNGTRWGVDGGCLAGDYGPQFVDYTEDNPRNWRSGFAVLTYRNGRLMWPEVVHAFDEGKVDFRGEVIEV